MKIVHVIALALVAGSFIPSNTQAKYLDNEDDLVYYGYRYYNPSGGRWLSRDPIEEKGEKNLYGFVCNQPLSRVDLLGHTLLEFVPEQWPQGQQNGHYTSWNIRWKLPEATPPGYIIQEIQWTFSVQPCYEPAPWSLDTIWNKIGYQGSTRIHYWEVWRKDAGNHFEAGGTDRWLLPQNSAFYQVPTGGSLTTTGSAAFYEVAQVDSNNEADQLRTIFGGTWVRNGAGDSGSPMSGYLFATKVQPTLPSVNEITKRTETVTWCCPPSPTLVTVQSQYDTSH